MMGRISSLRKNKFMRTRNLLINLKALGKMPPAVMKLPVFIPNKLNTRIVASLKPDAR